MPFCYSNNPLNKIDDVYVHIPISPLFKSYSIWIGFDRNKLVDGSILRCCFLNLQTAWSLGGTYREAEIVALFSGLHYLKLVLSKNILSEKLKLGRKHLFKICRRIKLYSSTEISHSVTLEWPLGSLPGCDDILTQSNEFDSFTHWLGF